MTTAAWRATVATLQRLDRVHQLSRRRSRLENAMLALALVAIACVMVESELFWQELQDHHSEDATFAPSVGFLVLKCALSTATLALVVLLVLRYHVACRILVETQQVDPRATLLSASSGLRRRFLTELLVCAVHVPPWTSSLATLQSQRRANFFLDQLDVLVLFRIYLLGRFLRNALGFSAAASPYYAHLISAFHRVDTTTVWFTLKCAFHQFPFLATVAALGVDWVLTSVGLNFLERGRNEKLTNMNEAIWLAIVTMTSVGYGEIAPQTLGGKLTIVLGAIVGGTVITCLLRVVLIDALRISPQEKVVLDVVEFHGFARRQKDAAAFLVQQAWKWRRARAHKGAKESTFKHRVYAAAEALRLLRFTRPATGTAPSTAPSYANATMAEQLQALQDAVAARRSRSLLEMHATAQLFRNIAATSRA